MGLSAAASVRVGNALGAGKPEQAKLSSKVPVVCTCKKLNETRTENRHVNNIRVSLSPYRFIKPWLLICNIWKTHPSAAFYCAIDWTGYDATLI